MAHTLGFELIRETILNTSVFGIGWLIPIALSGLSIWLITRDINKWKILAFPVLTGWYISGLRSGTLFDSVILVAAAAMFVIEAMSIEGLGRLASTIRIKAQEIVTQITEEEREMAKRMGILVKEKNILERRKDKAHERRLASLTRDIKLSLGKRGTRETLIQSRKEEELERIQEAAKQKEREEDRIEKIKERIRKARMHEKEEKKSQILSTLAAAARREFIRMNPNATEEQITEYVHKKLKPRREMMDAILGK